MSGGHAERTRRMLYGRRKGPKLSAHQQHLLDYLLPTFELHLKPGADPRFYFAPPPGGADGRQLEDVWLEIGFGGGEHLIWQARRQPNVGFIGAEPYVNGVVKLLSKLDSLSPYGGEGHGEGDGGNQKTEVRIQEIATNESSTDFRILNSDFRTSPRPGPPHKRGRGTLWNIRIYMGDARDILEVLPDASLGRVFILFPDPWPKTRHHKRRLVQMEVLDELARAMKPSAELRFASDDAAYVEWTLERLMAHPAFGWTATCAPDWQIRPADWPPTRYEAKQLHGKPAFLRFVRNPVYSKRRIVLGSPSPRYPLSSPPSSIRSQLRLHSPASVSCS